MESEKKDGGKRKNIVVGQWGGNGGTSWDDGSYSGIREIILVYNRCIDSIRVEYDKYGKPVLAEKHGGQGGNQIANVKLRCPEEFLIDVSGYYGQTGNVTVIRSLAFKTNQRSFGPFGVEEGIPFSFAMEGGFIVGFRGRSGSHLDAIGFHLSSFHKFKILDTVHSMLHKLIGQNKDEETYEGNHNNKKKAHV